MVLSQSSCETMVVVDVCERETNQRGPGMPNSGV